ncbi:MAG TPA: hypothetical protein VLY85_04745, partial [Thermoplasmata archaeon]|nr:hypothetical protein [Thermoplasmata archaeon]
MGPTRISDNLRIALTLALTAALLAALWSVPYSTRTGPRGVRLAAEAGGVEFLNVTVTDSLQFTLS